jgi:uncharacterized protein YndB with AHSA1/START domain
MTTDPDNRLDIVHVLGAPRETVWRACQEPAVLKQWWGMPFGCEMLACTVDFRVGGTKHYATQRPGRPVAWFLCRYLEIVPGERLVLTQHRSDENGAQLDSADRPASTITLGLEDLDGKTSLTVAHMGMASELATVDDYRHGWSETLYRLSDGLSHLQSNLAAQA